MRGREKGVGLVEPCRAKFLIAKLFGFIPCILPVLNLDEGVGLIILHLSIPATLAYYS